MTGRSLERELENSEDEEGEVCGPVESNLIRSREVCWRGAREKVVCSDLRDLAEFPRNMIDVFRLIPQISIFAICNAARWSLEKILISADFFWEERD